MTSNRSRPAPIEPRAQPVAHETGRPQEVNPDRIEHTEPAPTAAEDESGQRKALTSAESENLEQPAAIPRPSDQSHKSR